MKKIMVTIISIVLSMILIACDAKTSNSNSATSSVSTITTTSITTVPVTVSFTKPVVDWIIPQYVPGSIIEETTNENYIPSEENLYVSWRHRWAWGVIPGEVEDLVSDEESLTWNDHFKTLEMTPNGEPAEMCSVSYVKFFNISKADFEIAIERARETQYISPEDNPLDEFFELPNPDIVYTFDDEIISNYYRRE